MLKYGKYAQITNLARILQIPQIRCIRNPFVDSYTERKARGFTLIEIIVSIAILIIAVFGVNELLTQGISAARRAEKLTVAVNIAQAQIETLLSQQYTTLPIGTYEAKHIVFEKFSRKTTINYIDPNTLQTVTQDTGLKRINTTVYYTLPGGEKSYTLSTIISEQ